MKADGSVIIDTKINDDGLMQGFERLKTDAKSLGVTCEKAGDKIKTAFADYDVSANIQNAVDKLNELQAKLAGITANIQSAPAKKNELVEQLKDIDAKADAAKQKLREMQDAARGTYSKEQIAEAKDDVAMYVAQAKELESQITRLDAQTSRWLARQNAACDQVATAQHRLTQVIAAEANKQAAAEERAQIKATKATEREAAKKKKAQEKAYNDATKGARKFGNRLSRILSGALVFNALSSGIRQLTSYFGKVLKTNSAFSAQLSSLKAAFYTAFQPIYEFVLPALIRLIQGLTSALQGIGAFLANLFGKSYAQISQNAEALYQQSNALDSVGSSAKEAKKQLAGFDQISKLEKSDTGASSGSSTTAVTPNFTQTATTVSPQMGKILEYATAIGAAFAAWKISEGLAAIIGRIAEKLGEIVALTGGTGFLFLLDFFAMAGELSRYVKDIEQNGANLENVSGVIASLAGMAGNLAVLSGNTGLGVALKFVQGIGEIVSACAEIGNAGVSWESVAKAVKGLSDIVIAIGVLKKSWATVGISFSIQGLTTVIAEIAENWEAIKKGDWSGVDKAELAIASIEAIGGIVVAIISLKKAVKGVKGGKAVEEVAEVLENVGGGVSGLAGKLTTVAKDIGLGTLILAEIGVAVGLFLAEIWGMGWLLEQIGQSWQPVLANGEAIAIAIGVGTGLLIGIGAATALLGAATLATGGALPAAIALGTALLVELAGAFVVFTESLVAVAVELGENLAPALEALNPKIPALTDNMSDFVDFMTEFASEFVRYSGVSIVAGLAATIGKIIGWFLDDPVRSMSDEVKNEQNQFKTLNRNLEAANPDIEKSIKLVKRYNQLMEEFSEVSGGGEKPSVLTFLTDIVSGVWDSIKGTINKIISGIEKMTNSVISGLNGMINALNKLSFDVPEWVPNIGGEKFGFHISKIPSVSIPRLAKGSVIPPNKEFLAVLGDQKHGTNIEAPLTTIQEAVALVMEDMTDGMMAGFEALLEENQRLRAAVEGIEVGDSTIGQAANRYNQRMAMIRG